MTKNVQTDILHITSNCYKITTLPSFCTKCSYRLPTGRNPAAVRVGRHTQQVGYIICTQFSHQFNQLHKCTVKLTHIFHKIYK